VTEALRPVVAAIVTAQAEGGKTIYDMCDELMDCPAITEAADKIMARPARVPRASAVAVAVAVAAQASAELHMGVQVVTVFKDVKRRALMSS
jgi:hypothetical protein